MCTGCACVDLRVVQHTARRRAGMCANALTTCSGMLALVCSNAPFPPQMTAADVALYDALLGVQDAVPDAWETYPTLAAFM